VTKTQIVFFFVSAAMLAAQNPIAIKVDAAKSLGAYKAIYGYFGYDEPNYTYTANGKKLIRELATLSSTPVYVRTHFMLASGDGTPGLKWGSTNAYTEDAAGKPVYDWTIVDRILSTYIEAGAKPFVEIGFMPQALSSKPDPYHPTWIPGARNDQYSIGWSYPPNDYQKWGNLVNEWVKHSIAKWGKTEVESWYWEVWNEPDISYWHGTAEEYDKLYDFAADGVKRALPSARVGGPASTGPGSEKAAKFLTQFLEHCVSGKNAATGETGAPLDFITYHAKGRPENAGTHIRMGMAKEVEDVRRGFEIVRAFPSLKDLPIVLSEADPEGCAACSSRVYPQNAYRNGTLYPAYTALMLKNIFDLADGMKLNLEGMLTWAFEFENQPYFDGFRTLATNGIDKPVLNVFRMAGLLEGDRVAVESAGHLAVEAIGKDGVRGGKVDVDALATRASHSISLMVWNYQDDDMPGDAAQIRLEVTGIPRLSGRVLMNHYRIDQTHSNAYTAWKDMGSPTAPTPEQYAKLEAAGRLELLDSPHWIESHNGSAIVPLTLPLQAISLIELSW
jgi:xylan 1,4-beta-xylosidase